MDGVWTTMISAGGTLVAIGVSWGSLRQKMEGFIVDHNRRHEELNTLLDGHAKDSKERFLRLEERLFSMREMEGRVQRRDPPS